MRIVVAAAFLCATAVATAQPAPPREGPMPGGMAMGSVGRSVPPVGVLLTGFDTDHDARITRDEFRAGTHRAFAQADADRNGEIGLIELSSWSAVWLGDGSALPGRFDFDRDGSDTVSAAEFAAELDRRFTAFDADKDGVIVRAELLQRPAMARPVGEERRRAVIRRQPSQ